MPIPPRNKKPPAPGLRLAAPQGGVFTPGRPGGKKPRDDGGFETLASSDDASPDEAASGEAGKPDRRGPSLKARAVGYLSRREHARDELARKLRPYAEDPDEVEAVLDALQREGWQSNERFAQSLVHRRAPLRGTARIVQELKQHGVDDAVVAEASARLKATELDRARAVWAKRYGAKPADRTEYARQARFLASRGFSPEVIRRILGKDDEDI